MEHFSVKPDYSILSRYYHFSQSQEDFERLYVDGTLLIAIEPYLNSHNQWKFTGEHIQDVEKGFREILERYNLQAHYDNLMYLMLTKLVQLDAVRFEEYDSYIYKKRFKEFAQLILAFKKTEARHFTSLNLKTLTDTIKVSDGELINWIGTVLQKSLDNGQLPASIFGLQDWGVVTEDDLKRVASQRLSRPNINYRKSLAEFCLYLYPYLIHETSIRPNPETTFSDDMLNFFFQSSVLLEMLTADDIDSEPTDYMRTILMNRIKLLNH